MSDYFGGIALLALTDLILLLAGLTVYRGRAMQSHKGLPALLAAAAAAGALLGHFVMLYFAAALISDKFTVLVISCFFGLFPATIYAAILRDAFADRAINIIMGSEDGLDKPDLTAARAYAIKGDLENARRAYQASAKRYPQSPEPLFGLESVYMLEQKYESAANVCRDILRKFASDAQTRQRAAARLAELLEDHLENPDGAAEARAKAEKAARAGWEPVKGVREQRAAATVGVTARRDQFTLEAARFQVKQGAIDEAVSTYRRFFDMNPGHPRPLLEAAGALEAAGEYHQAIEILRDVARRFPESPEHWAAATLRQATIHEVRLHDVDTARRILEIVEDRLPGTEQAQVASDRLAAIRAGHDK